MIFPVSQRKGTSICRRPQDSLRIAGRIIMTPSILTLLRPWLPDRHAKVKRLLSSRRRRRWLFREREARMLYLLCVLLREKANALASVQNWAITTVPPRFRQTVQSDSQGWGCHETMGSGIRCKSRSLGLALSSLEYSPIARISLWRPRGTAEQYIGRRPGF